MAVVQFRRIMVAAAKRFKETGAVIGAGKDRIPHVQLASYEGLVPKTTDWKTLRAPSAEPATAGRRAPAAA
jgi:phthalate 4,5-dioxygenase oxygenase subunit